MPKPCPTSPGNWKYNQKTDHWFIPGNPATYARSTKIGKCRAHDPKDNTVGEAINQMESGIRLSATINASPDHFRGLFG